MTQFGRDPRKPRAHRVPRVASTTAAIRSALALSAAVLALSGSGIAYAGTCATDAAAATPTISCNGAFADTVNNSIDPAEIVADLTLVLGDQAPTTVAPADYSVGVIGNWGGAVGITSHAEISTQDAYAVIAFGDTVTLDNQGYMVAGAVHHFSAETIRIQAHYDAEVDNSGVIYAVSGYGSATALDEGSFFGSVSLDNQAGAMIYAVSSADATGAHLFAFFGDADIDNAGTIGAIGNGGAEGLYVRGPTGIILDNSGLIDAESAYGYGTAVDLTTFDGEIQVDNSGTLSVSAGSRAVAVEAYNGGFGALTIHNSGSVSAVSSYYFSAGVYAYAHGDVDFSNSASGSVFAQNTGSSQAVRLDSRDGGVDFDNDGLIYAQGGYSHSFGVWIEGRGGDESLDNSGTIRAYAPVGAATGFYAVLSKSEALLDFHNSGDIDAFSYLSDATGVSLLAAASDANIHAVNDGTISATTYGTYASATGIAARGSHTGSDVTVNNGGYGEISVHASYSSGISAGSYSANIGITNDGIIDAYGVYHAFGVYGLTGGTSGDAGLQNSGSISAASYYGTAYGVLLKAAEGTASIDNAVDGTISASSAYHNAIGAEAGGHYATAVNHGTVSAVAYNGIAAGLTAGAGYGLAELGNSGSIAATGNYAYGAQVGSNYGDVYFDNSGTITATGAQGASGGRAISVYGVVTASNSGTISASAFSGARGLAAVGNYVFLYNTGEISASTYSGAASGIRVDTYGAHGIVDVNNYDEVEAYSTLGTARGIFVTDSVIGGEVEIDNSGSISAGSHYGTAYAVLANAVNGSASLDNAADGEIAATSYWSNAIGGELDGNAASAVNHGTIDAVSSYGVATGLNADASAWLASLRNSGSISATGNQAFGVQVIGEYGSAGLINTGTIEADGALQANGATLIANNGILVATNLGTISASATGATFGVLAYGDYYSYIYNDGDISALSQTGAAVALRLDGYGITELYNNGHVQASSVSGGARGIFVSDSSGYAQITVDHGGDVAASSTSSLASGIFVKLSHGDADVVSNGDISAHGGTTANGILGYAYNEADISVTTSAGEIIADAGSGSGRGIFVKAFGSGDATVSNGADIDASSNQYVQGMNVRSFSGDVSASNSGSITVTSSGGQADGILAASTSGDVYALNTGDIVATGSAFAQGMHLREVDGEVRAVNRGDISAYGGVQSANGIFALGTGTADLSVFNDGDILARGDMYAQALNLHAEAGGIVVANDGYLTAEASAAYAMGIRARITHSGDVTIGNEGHVSAASASTDAHGIYAYTLLGDISVDNGGDIHATGVGIAIGMNLKATGDIQVASSGLIHAAGDNTAWGIEVVTIGSGDVSITSSGSIEAEAINRNAVGVHSSGLAGDFHLYNEGLLSAASVNGDAFGVYLGLGTDDSLASVDNSGTIDVASDFANATGIHLEGGWEYDVLATGSSGAIAAQAYHGHATGVYANAYGYQGQASVDIGEDGSIHAISGYLAHGVIVEAGKYAELGNAGDIDVVASNEAHRYAYAGGAFVSTFYGQALLDNSGSISVLAEGLASRSSGATVSGNGANVALGNAGTISATAHGEHAANATGATAESALLSALVDNSGTLQALASADLADALGAFAYASESATVHTAAGSSIQAGAVGDTDADATGAYALGLFANVYGDGAISAHASANPEDGDARAYGARAYGNFTGIYVLGDGSATASAEGAYALAVGALQDGYFTAFRNEGTIAATATGDTGAAIGAMTLSGYSVHLYNEGEITAIAHGDGVSAAGLFAFSRYGEIDLDNAGSISASGDTLAVAVQLRTDYATHIDNSGTIDAKVAIYTSGLSLDYIHNEGLITGAILSGAGDDNLRNDGGGVWNAGATTSDFGTGDDGIVNRGAINLSGSLVSFDEGDDSLANWSSASLAGALVDFGAGEDGLVNRGTLTAAGSVIELGDGLDSVANFSSVSLAGSELLLGEGNDEIDNSGTLSLAGSLIDLGDGDDSIVNHGAIHLSGSLIDFGASDADGNTFYNYGVIRARGHSQIDMGSADAMTLVPALNPNAFYNDGVIDFQDGQPDDVLVITGDFDGDGDLNIDLSGLHGTSDLLYIDGDVASGSVTTINIDVLDMPEELEGVVPMVKVSGNWVAGNFVLGDVDLPFDAGNSFVTLDVGLAPTSDSLALAFEVTGLADAGAVATTVAPAVHGLVKSQVGTWRQRMGAIDRLTDGAVALWARVFQDRGSFAPGHASANFGTGGNFDWRQDNSGVEAGVDFSVTDELSLGLLLASSKADADLKNDGHGSGDIDADTWGIYGTWISPNGFYLDASYRRMSFDVDLRSSAGTMETGGDAETFNLELGHAWTLSGGLQIEPQLQYTKTRLDHIDALESSSGMSFRFDGGDSSRGRAGVALRKSFGAADTGWRWTPYASLSAVREFDGDTGYAINDHFVGETSLEGTSTLLELGVSAQHQGWSVFGGLNWQDGGAVESFFGGQFGVRYSFGGARP